MNNLPKPQFDRVGIASLKKLPLQCYELVIRVITVQEPRPGGLDVLRDLGVTQRQSARNQLSESTDSKYRVLLSYLVSPTLCPSSEFCPLSLSVSKFGICATVVYRTSTVYRSTQRASMNTIVPLYLVVFVDFIDSRQDSRSSGASSP